ncbi:hypothetical protein ACIGKR_17755 [Rhodococcus qingshengii]|uniref:hypothetical protein n=1 Tax=Rhodococcus qingshengii TaxID=334542 RepID=UPI0037C52DEA
MALHDDEKIGVLNQRDVASYIAALNDSEYQSLLKTARGSAPPPQPRPGTDRLAQGLDDVYRKDNR